MATLITIRVSLEQRCMVFLYEVTLSMCSQPSRSRPICHKGRSMGFDIVFAILTFGPFCNLRKNPFAKD